MAHSGNIEHLARILAADPRFEPAFRYLRRCLVPGSPEGTRIRALAADAVGEVHLDGDSVAFEQVYHTRERKDCFFESHRKYIDVQFILEGEETIDVIPTADLAIDEPYREERDLVKYDDPGAGARLHLRAGEAAVFFPEDGHMPGQSGGASALVRKTVVKVPVAG